MNAIALAVAGPPHHAFGGGSFLLAVLLLAALGFGAVRLTARRRAGSTRPDSPWSPASPAPPAPTDPLVPKPSPAPTAPPRPRRAVPSPDAGWAVETDGLTKRFGSNVAVNDVELRVPRGSAFGYLGPNGAGKTTLIRVLLGLTRADAGTMSLLGIPVPAERSRALARVGAIVDEPRFHAHLTGRENLACSPPPAAARREAGSRRPWPGSALADRADDKVASYSMGMRQRLGVASCLLGDPELLILDEPMNGLDPAGMHEMRDMIARPGRRGPDGHAVLAPAG